MDEAIKRQGYFKAYTATQAAATYPHDDARLSDPRDPPPVRQGQYRSNFNDTEAPGEAEQDLTRQGTDHRSGRSFAHRKLCVPKECGAQAAGSRSAWLALGMFVRRVSGMPVAVIFTASKIAIVGAPVRSLETPMQRDKLFLLRSDFTDPAHPGRRFYCWHCALMEGLIASFPELLARLDVERIAWPRPRKEIVKLIGEENQSVPLLVLADDAPKTIDASSYRGTRFVADKDAILTLLSRRHGIPEPHP